MTKYLAFRNTPGTVGTMIFTAILLLTAFCVHAAAGPVPTIQINGMDDMDALSSQSAISVTILLDAGDRIGDDAEWWILAETPMGWFSYIYPGTWAFSGEDGADLTPAYEGPLFDLTEPFEVLNMTGLPTGSYAFYFAVDTQMDGLLDLSAVSYDAAAVQVVEEVVVSGAFPVVDTGQDTCYNDLDSTSCPNPGEAFYGQDAQFTDNAPSYTDNGDGIITDNITGLMWQQSPDTDGDGDIDAHDKLTYDQAVAGAGTLSLGGYTDWRLPSIKELYSLINFIGKDPSGYEGTDTSRLVPFIDTAYFDFAYGDTSAGERIIDAQYASLSKYVSTTMNGNETMFGVNFADGRIKGYGTSMPCFVIYVRENTSYGGNSFIDNGDGTITDSASGLMWSQNDNGTGLNWEEALAWVDTQNAANYLGYSDWRLSNVKELQSIVDYTRSPDTTASAAIDPLFNVTSIINEAGETDYPYFWTGTTHANWTSISGGNAAYVAFGRSLGYMNGEWIDVHGAGSQRSDPKAGDPADYPTGHGPQGDAIRIYNYVRLVRDVTGN